METSIEIERNTLFEQEAKMEEEVYNNNIGLYYKPSNYIIYKILNICQYI